MTSCNKRLRFLASALLSSALILMPRLSTAVSAQATAGGIQGVVSDVSGAVVPNAPVTAKNNATGVESKTMATGEGLYNIPNLQPGRYSVIVQAPGFKKSEALDVEVSIGRHTVVDIILQPGAVTESVTVSGTTEVLVEKDTAQVSGRFTGRTITDLPMATGGGGMDRIALAMPGVFPGFGNVNSNGVTLSVNGNRARANNFTVDGADNNDLSIGGPNYFISNKELVQEVQVVTSNFSAEYGRNSGAEVNYVSKAGTNDYHGAATWYHRDRRNWDALTNIEKRRGDLHPPRNLVNVVDFGVGGPVGIPKLISGKDKLFFFVAGEFIRNPGIQDQNSTTLAVTPPGLATLKAAFPNNPAIQYYVNNSPFAIPIGNPQIRTDVAQSTVTIGSVTVPVAAVHRTTVVPNNSNEYNIRIDSNVSSKNRIFGRYFHQSSPGLNALIGVDGWNGNQPSTSIFAGGSWLYNLSTRSLNEFRFNYSKLSVIFGGGCEAAIPGCVPDPKDIDKALTNFNLQFTAANGQSLLAIGPATNLPQGRVVKSYNFTDNYSITSGLHQIKFGGDIHRLLNSVPFLPSVNGAYTFATAAQFAANTPQLLTVALGPSSLDYTEWDKFFYFQDDWRIKPNLTLNLGIRYENTGQPINLLHDLSVKRESDPGQAFWRQNLPLEARTVPKIPTDNNNFAPRVGFVWTPKFDSSVLKRMFGENDTVVRGGYGVTYDAVFYNLLLNISTSAPFVFNTSAVLPVPDAVPTGDKVRAAAVSAGLIKFNTFDPRFLNRTLVDSGFRSPYTQQWSLGVQRQLSRDYVLEVRYVGNHQVGLFQTINANPFMGNLINGFARSYRDPNSTTTKTFNFPGFPNLFPGVTPLSCTDNPATPDNEGACNGRLLPSGPTRQRINGAVASYHGLQNRFEGRYKDWLHFGVNFTLSHVIDNSSEVFQFNGGNSVVVAQNPLDITRGERGDSGFDARYGFSAYWVWDIPFMKDQHGILGHALGGWQLNGIARIQSERRFNPIMQATARNPYDDQTTMVAFFGSQGQMRPFSGNPKIPLMPNGTTLVGITDVDACIFYGKCGASGGVPILIPSPTGFYLMNDLNKGVFTPVTQNDVRFIINGPGAAMKFGTPFGNIGRNSFTGDRIEALDFSIFKTTKIRERFAIQYRLNLFNALNHPTFGIPNSIRLDNAGTTFFNFQENSGGRRTLEMAIRLSF